MTGKSSTWLKNILSSLSPSRQLAPGTRKMETSLLICGLLTFTMVTSYMEAHCPVPPKISNAIFKAYIYKKGTHLHCNCTKGFRRLLHMMSCTGNSSHVSWENKCQCRRLPGSNPGKPITHKPEEQEERKITKMESQTQSLTQVNLLGHCREPPPWEHEAEEREYVFVVGQTVQYQCVEGYKARQRGLVTSTCRTVCGHAEWTRPRLTCTNEVTPGKEEEEFSLPESEISCPSITTALLTVPEKTTEVVTSAETFVFTIKYQIAVAGCAFLLTCVLLLSGFTWRRKWRKSRRAI